MKKHLYLLTFLLAFSAALIFSDSKSFAKTYYLEYNFYNDDFLPITEKINLSSTDMSTLFQQYCNLLSMFIELEDTAGNYYSALAHPFDTIDEYKDEYKKTIKEKISGDDFVHLVSIDYLVTTCQLNNEFDNKVIRSTPFFDITICDKNHKKLYYYDKNITSKNITSSSNINDCFYKEKIFKAKKGKVRTINLKVVGLYNKYYPIVKYNNKLWIWSSFIQYESYGLKHGKKYYKTYKTSS